METTNSKSHSEQWLSQNAFAKKIGVTQKAVTFAIEGGRFDEKALREERTKTKKVRYKINLEEGRKQWEQNRSKGGRATDDQVVNAKRVEQISKARIAELDLQEREGSLVNVEEMKTFHSKIATELVSGVDNEITRLAPSLLAINNANEMEKALRVSFMGYFEKFANACEGKGPLKDSLR